MLTSYPLFFAFMGDMLGGGFVLALGGFFATLAAVDTANPYGPMGASRTRMVGFLAEPVFMIVFFTVSFVAGSTIPYIVQQQWVTPLANFFAPSHVLLVLAFLMLILAEGGRIPVDNPTGHFELAMIDESKSLEYSGRGFALVKWGGQMKFFVLLCIFLNVLLTPWGLARATDARRGAAGHTARALQGFLLSAGAGGHRVVAGQTAAVSHRRVSGRRVHHLRRGHDRAGLSALSCTMSDATKQSAGESQRAGGGPVLADRLRHRGHAPGQGLPESVHRAIPAARGVRGAAGLALRLGHLYGVALVNLISKPIIVPWLLRRTSPAEIYTRREIDQVLNIPTALLIALALAIGAYFVGIPLANAVGPEFRGPNVPIGIAVLLLGAFTLTVRREALPLLIGLLVDGERRVPRRHFHRARSRHAGRAGHRHRRLGHRVHHGRAGPRRAEADRHHRRRRVGEPEGNGRATADADEAVL